MPVALVTGGSLGFGRALATELAARNWRVVIDGRDPTDLEATAAALPRGAVRAIAGDISDPGHRRELMAAATEEGGLDLLVNNASFLGPSPQPLLASYPLDVLQRVFEVNVLAPLALIQVALPVFGDGGVVVNVTSDAAVEAYEGWGGYGSSKAALEGLTRILGVEHPALHIYAFDPGDMRTRMHQEAFPGEDISDRPEPGIVVPSLLRLIDERPPSGRYRASDLLVSGSAS
ncbi:MAG: SDR family NAD(P)-dependent oxidoreductase [Actinobacteria bacterium]|nr:SDR family NAD(P)-dependent oxidoreductase [Actinomycetota bacterium]